jgi:5-methyltetrahydropteroyltriglutamate--homocysteine methyltransferase
MNTAAPNIRTTVVGSYPVPAWLAALPSEQALVDATRVVLHTQERAGIDLVCDGELYRRPLAGMRAEVSFEELQAYRAVSGMAWRAAPPAVCEGPIGHGTLDLVSPCARAVRLASKPLKFTLTGAHMLAKTVLDRHYGDVEAIAHAIADVLAEQVALLDAAVLQLDEANLPGHPDEWRWAASAINRVLDAVPTTPAVHLCFGNYGGQVVQEGTWAKLIDYLNALHVDHVVLECAHHPLGELEVFKDLRPEIGFGLGVIDIKRTEVESAEQIARAIERAEAILGPGRVRWVHPDCGFWMLGRSIADAKIKALAAGRDLYEGRRSSGRDAGPGGAMTP